MAKDIKIGKTVLKEDDLKIPVMYNGEKFTLKYPTMVERTMIETEIANRLGGNPRSAFPAAHVQMVEATAYVTNLLILEESPSWFENAWGDQSYDENLIATLYNGYLSFRVKFQKKFRSD